MSSIFSRRYRGFRVIEIFALTLLLLLVLGVYLAKTVAGGERAEIARLDRAIADERVRSRLLKAEVAYLEQPRRLERLATNYLGLAPIKAEQEIESDRLAEIAARLSQPRPAPAPAAPENNAAAASDQPVPETPGENLQ
ncbi:cell division protein FtsL [Caulobacter sp. NIBR2454]|uniref:cell division protein FtsL n=1 Tax=Caulobacter sp. NIBR2454 TaxID=3015996 RepID=UPI0022B608B0|nr:cell division protein [Caulobacter sp. NIBR2454]